MRGSSLISLLLGLMPFSAAGADRAVGPITDRVAATVTSTGPEGGAFVSVAADPQNPQILYAGARGAGVFKTIDGGTKWIHAGLAGFTVVALAIDPRDTKVVYADVAIADDEGDLIEPQVFKTLNGGRTWAAASTGLPTVCGLGSLLVDSLGPGTLYAWTGCGGVFRRDDAADAWQPVNSGLPDREPGSGIGPMAVDPQSSTLYVVAYHCDQTGKFPPPACDSRVFRSLNRGESWTEATSAALTGTMIQALAIDPRSPNTLYARTLVTNMQNELLKSRDGGETWVATNLQTGPGCCISVLAVDSRSAVYAGGLGGLFKSADAGASWSAIPFFPAPTSLSALAVDPQNPDVVYAAGDTGIYKTANGGTDWTAVHAGLRATGVSAVAINPQSSRNLYAGSYSSGVFRTPDGGINWGKADSVPGSAYVLIVHPAKPNTVYAAVGGRGEWVNFGGGVFRSDDAGANWTAMTSGMTTEAAVTSMAIDPRHPDTLYAGTWGGGVFKTEDGASTWKAMNVGLAQGTYQPIVTALAVGPQNSGILYAGGWAPGNSTNFVPTLFKSVDGAVTWKRIAQDFSQPAGPCCVTISAVAIDPLDDDTLYVATTSTDGGLWRSTDSGSSWRNLLPSGESIENLGIDARQPNRIYATSGSGVIASNDRGESWTSVPGSPVYANVLTIDPENPNVLFAGGVAGLFRIKLDGAPSRR